MVERWLNRRYTDFQKFCCKILKSGPIPKHIALIMDGNRRFARRQSLDSVLQGHTMGFDALSRTLEWCKELNVTEVTVYAFSIENFKRSENEVNGLMDLARQKLEKILSEIDKMEKNSICFRFLGNLSLMPADIQQLIARITILSMKNTKFYLNVCIAYTSRDEVARAIETIATGVRMGSIEETDIDTNLISSVLDSRKSPDPDLLIRTSGENRFSDFLLYQCSYSCLYFDDVLWPDYNFWHLFRAVLYYQLHSSAIQKIKTSHEGLSTNQSATDKDEDQSKQTRIHAFLAEFNEQQMNILKDKANLDAEPMNADFNPFRIRSF